MHSDETRQARQGVAASYLAQYQRILALLPSAPNLAEATYESDTRTNTDYVVHTVQIDLACRVRFMRGWKGLLDPYKDVTVRTRPGGPESELAKLRRGVGGRYLYCWATTAGEPIIHYVYFDIPRACAAGVFDDVGAEIINLDGSAFVAIPTHRLRSAGAMLAEGHVAEAETPQARTPTVAEEWEAAPFGALPCAACRRPRLRANLTRLANGELWCPTCLYDLIPERRRPQ